MILHVSWCILCYDFTCVVMYFMLWFYLCCGVFCQLWHITCVMMYFICYDVLHMLWCILWVMTYYMCRDGLSQLWVVRCVGDSFMSSPGPISAASTTLHILAYTCLLGTWCSTFCLVHQVSRWYTDDTMHILSCVWCPDGSHMCLSIMSYMVESCMIYMSYIGHTFSFTVYHFTRCPQINTPTHLRQLILC